MTDFGLVAINSGESIALRGVKVSACISALLAETTLTQKYRNDSEDNLELSYMGELDRVVDVGRLFGIRCYPFAP